MVIFNKNLFAVLVGFCILYSSFVGAMTPLMPSLKTCCIKELARNPVYVSFFQQVINFHTSSKKAEENSLGSAFLAIARPDTPFIQDCLALNSHAHTPVLDKRTLTIALSRAIRVFGDNSIPLLRALVDQGAALTHVYVDHFAHYAEIKR